MLESFIIQRRAAAIESLQMFQSPNMDKARAADPATIKAQ